MSKSKIHGRKSKVVETFIWHLTCLLDAYRSTFHYILIYVSGLFEIIFGLMIFFQKSRFYGAWGIFSLLILVYPANIYLYESTEIQEILSVSKDQTFIRLLFQFPLIVLSFWHTRDFNSKIFNIFCCVIFVPTLIYFLTL